MCTSVTKFAGMTFIMIISACIFTAGADTKLLGTKAAEDSFNSFTHESRTIRLGLVYAGSFFSEEDRGRLYELAHKTATELDQLYNQQQQRSKQIEEYDGDDWEELYGATGLWRKSKSDEIQTLWLKCHVDHYLAAASGEAEKVSICNDILEKCDLLQNNLRQTKLDLLKAKVFILLGKEYIKDAKNLIGSVIDAETKDQARFEAMILKLGLTEHDDQQQFERFYRELKESKWKDDLELNLKLALTALKAQNPEPIEYAVKKWRKWSIKPFSHILLSEMTYLQGQGTLTERVLRSKSNIEIELAAEAILQAGASKHTQLLEKIYRIDKFRFPSVLYAMGQIHTESKPGLAIKYFLRAAKKQNSQKDLGFRVYASSAAFQAAKLGFYLYSKDTANCRLAEEAIGYYLQTAGDNPDEYLEYSYAGLLKDCGKSKDPKKILERIAAGNGQYSKRAKLDLITSMLEENPGQVQKSTEKKLYELIYTSNENDIQIRLEAAGLYCQLLMGETGIRSAGKAVEILAETVNDDDDCDLGNHGILVLSEVLEYIDEQLEGTDRPEKFIGDCRKIADHCLECSDDDLRSQAELIRVEIGIFAAEKNKEKLAEISRILSKMGPDDDNIDRLRCYARLYAALGRFDEAARKWEQICAARKPRKRTEKHDRLWWRAKYHQLWCTFKQPVAKRDDINHAIEILENSFDDIPEFWAEKLGELNSEIAGNDR